MIKAKLLALCVCPAVATPPAIVAASPPARHAVARAVLHVADRLDRPWAPASPSPQLLAACPPPLVTADPAPVATLGGPTAVGDATQIGRLAAFRGGADLAGDSDQAPADGIPDVYGRPVDIGVAAVMPSPLAGGTSAAARDRSA